MRSAVVIQRISSLLACAGPPTGPLLCPVRCWAWSIVPTNSMFPCGCMWSSQVRTWLCPRMYCANRPRWVGRGGVLPQPRPQPCLRGSSLIVLPGAFGCVPPLPTSGPGLGWIWWVVPWFRRWGAAPRRAHGSATPARRPLSAAWKRMSGRVPVRCWEVRRPLRLFWPRPCCVSCEMCPLPVRPVASSPAPAILRVLANSGAS